MRPTHNEGTRVALSRNHLKSVSMSSDTIRVFRLFSPGADSKLRVVCANAFTARGMSWKNGLRQKCMTGAINRGDLDYYLVRPISSLFFVSLRDFAADSFVNLVMAAGILAWSLARYPDPFPPFRIILFVVMILLGAILRYYVRMAFIIPTFYTHSGRGFEMVFFHLNRFIERPDRIFYGTVRTILTTVLPFCLMASFPARILLEEPFNYRLTVHFFAVTISFAVAVTYLRHRGLRAYSSASS